MSDKPTYTNPSLQRMHEEMQRVMERREFDDYMDMRNPNGHPDIIRRNDEQKREQPVKVPQYERGD